MAIAALALWMCTVAVGAYLLATASRYGNAEPAPSEAVSVSAGQPSTSPADAAAPAAPARVRTPSPRRRCSANGASHCRS